MYLSTLVLTFETMLYWLMIKAFTVAVEILRWALPKVAGI